MGGLERRITEWMRRLTGFFCGYGVCFCFNLASVEVAQLGKVQLIPKLLCLKQEVYENSREYGPNCVFLEMYLRPRISDLLV